MLKRVWRVGGGVRVWAELPRRWWGTFVRGERRRWVVGGVGGGVVVAWIVAWRWWGPTVVLLPGIVRP